MYYHPPLTAFPAALFTAVVLLELLGIWYKADWVRVTARVNLVLAAGGVLLAFISGYQAIDVAQQTFQVENDVINNHHMYGRLLLFAVVPCVALGLIQRPLNRT